MECLPVHGFCGIDSLAKEEEREKDGNREGVVLRLFMWEEFESAGGCLRFLIASKSAVRSSNWSCQPWTSTTTTALAQEKSGKLSPEWMMAMGLGQIAKSRNVAMSISEVSY